MYNWTEIVMNDFGKILLTIATCSVILGTAWFIAKSDPTRDRKYEIVCAVLTPEGPAPTIKTEATNARITDFGVIISDEGLYIPTTNEICFVKEQK